MSPAAWPLSAAATAILRNPRTSSTEVLKLSLKELVVRKVWVLERRVGRGLRAKETLHFMRGTADVPALAPLPYAHEQLERALDGWGSEVRTVARHLASLAVPSATRDRAVGELVARHLVAVERRKVLGLFPRTVVVLTPSGELWAQDVAERTAQFELAVEQRSPTAPADLLAMGALVLFVAPPVLGELDGLLRRPVVEGGGGTSGSGGGIPYDADGPDLDVDLGGLDGFSLDDLDVFDSLDSGFDSAFDSGASDGGGGGGSDGGGGGGDGGGGGGG